MSYIRITGGQARGQKIHVPAIRGVRPSPDRARTTLFNWLMPFPENSAVLDLYAGSGILTFEALSRGAQTAHLVEIHKKVSAHLATSFKNWPFGNAQIHTSNCLKWLQHHTDLAPFDVIFLDPPFHQPQLLTDTLEAIHQYGYLAENGFLYTERAEQTPAPLTAAPFSVHREKRFGAVIGTLYLK